MVELIEQGKAAVDDLIDTMGRASIEAVLLIGAAQVAGPRKRGKRDDSAAGSLREGLAEMFTVNRLGLPGALCRCLTSTNLIDSTHSGVRGRTGRVTHWQNGAMALRWSAGAFDTTAKHYRKIMCHHQLWMLKAHLDAPTEAEEVADPRRTG
jgi:hypothetical protein